ncbi:hypothetical protein AB0420_35785 [Streptomyces caelestis]|uniref:Uncharacterized protein n=1 Tax=Streptomyces heliomycini TaxID=284032 RepID=A0ABV5LFT0_9ACTN
MSEGGGRERESGLMWADGAGHGEPSARARTLAARRRDNPPGQVPFRGEPEYRGPSGRSSWVSAAVVLGRVVEVTVLLGHVGLRPY